MPVVGALLDGTQDSGRRGSGGSERRNHSGRCVCVVEKRGGASGHPVGQSRGFISILQCFIIVKLGAVI